MNADAKLLTRSLYYILLNSPRSLEGWRSGHLPVVPFSLLRWCQGQVGFPQKCNKEILGQICKLKRLLEIKKKYFGARKEQQRHDFVGRGTASEGRTSQLGQSHLGKKEKLFGRDTMALRKRW